MLKIFSTLSAAISIIGVASAAPITTNTFVGAAVQDFSAFPEEITSGPKDVSVGGDTVTWNSDAPNAGFSFGLYDLGQNRDWTSARNGYVGLNNVSPTSMRFTFDEGVSGVGGLVNYAVDGGIPGGPVIIRVYDSAMNILEEFNLGEEAPIATDVNDTGAFRGFSRDLNDIFMFELSGGFVVIDDLTWVRDGVPISNVPLPAALPMFLIGLAGFRIFGKRARLKVQH